jgi:formyl-CoA transferase
MADTGTIAPLAAPPTAGMRTIMSPIRMDGQALRPPGPAPGVGEHTEEVLRAAGYDDAAIARLRAAGALGPVT